MGNCIRSHLESCSSFAKRTVFHWQRAGKFVYEPVTILSWIPYGSHIPRLWHCIGAPLTNFKKDSWENWASPPKMTLFTSTWHHYNAEWAWLCWGCCIDPCYAKAPNIFKESFNYHRQNATAQDNVLGDTINNCLISAMGILVRTERRSAWGLSRVFQKSVQLFVKERIVLGCSGRKICFSPRELAYSHPLKW